MQDFGSGRGMVPFGGGMVTFDVGGGMVTFESKVRLLRAGSFPLPLQIVEMPSGLDCARLWVTGLAATVRQQ